MLEEPTFDLNGFVPYLLNQAAEETSRGFEAFYKSRFGMLRAEWRVVFHLGHYGPMTARDICARARMHKTKISRAVQALETKRYLLRKPCRTDLRQERLSLTREGERVFRELVKEAQRFDANLLKGFTAAECAQIREMLKRLARLG